MFDVFQVWIQLWGIWIPQYFEIGHFSYIGSEKKLIGSLRKFYQIGILDMEILR